ncbi:hypothetical protein [Hominifimenecus sp. rT4P-3]|uniref:hypothetical protein n=1 Tax=Hominifimenecus sp. rT4P-3 TaxID=3242979 RepID=UPI003DA1DA06
MDFFEFKDWAAAHQLTFELEAFISCFPDTIIVKDQNGKEVYTGEYNRWVDYSDVVKTIEENR